MYKAVVFDLDHTLFDRYATFESILERKEAYTVFKDSAKKEEILNEWTYADKSFVHLNAKHWDLSFDHLKSKGMLLDSVKKENFFVDNIAKLFYLTAIPYPDTISTLEALKAEGIKLGIITNGRHTLQMKKIEILGIEKYFDEIIISGDYGVHKPDRILFDTMAQKLNFEPDEILFVGDNPINDIEGARNAGYKTAWINATGFWATPELKRADYEINKLKELIKIINL